MKQQVRFKLAIDDIGGEQQRALPELRKLLRLQRRVGLRRGIDNHHLVGPVDEVLRHSLSGDFAGDAPDEFLLFGDVREIDRGDDGNAGVEQLVDVLVPLGMTASRRIVVREPVDKRHPGAASKDRGHVDDRDAVDGFGRHALERAGHRFGLRIHVRLQGGDDDVFAALVAAASLVEHAKGLADARRIAEKNLQLAPLFGALRCLHAPKERLGVGAREPVVGVGRHQSFVQSLATRMASSETRFTTSRLPGGGAASRKNWLTTARSAR